MLHCSQSVALIISYQELSLECMGKPTSGAPSQAAGGRRLHHRTFSALPLTHGQQSAGFPHSSPNIISPTTSRRHKRPHAPVGGPSPGPAQAGAGRGRRPEDGGSSNQVT